MALSLSLTNLEDKKFAQESSRSYADGEIVFAEGDDSREMYVVQEGEVVVSKITVKGEVVIASLKKGDFVGEMSLLESLPRSATARAKGSTRLLAIQPGGFLLKIRRDPTFAFEMLQTLSRRIRNTNDKLMATLANDTVSSHAIKSILNHAEFQNQTEVSGESGSEKPPSNAPLIIPGKKS